MICSNNPGGNCVTRSAHLGPTFVDTLHHPVGIQFQPIGEDVFQFREQRPAGQGRRRIRAVDHLRRQPSQERDPEDSPRRRGRDIHQQQPGRRPRSVPCCCGSTRSLTRSRRLPTISSMSSQALPLSIRRSRRRMPKFARYSRPDYAIRRVTPNRHRRRHPDARKCQAAQFDLPHRSRKSVGLAGSALLDLPYPSRRIYVWRYRDGILYTFPHRRCASRADHQPEQHPDRPGSRAVRSPLSASVAT